MGVKLARQGGGTESTDDQEWSEWTYYTAKDIGSYGKTAYQRGRKVRTVYNLARSAKPYARKLAPAGRAALRTGGKAIVRIAPKGAVAVGEKAAAGLATAAPAAGPIGAVIATGVALGGLAEHFGVRTYIENEMRGIERFFGRNISAKAPGPRW